MPVGNLVDWWEDVTEAKFAVKAQCMVEQVWLINEFWPVDFINFLNISNSIQIMWISIRIYG